MSSSCFIKLIAAVLALLVGLAVPVACGSVGAQASAAPATSAGIISASPTDEGPQPWGDNFVRVANDETDHTQHAVWKDPVEPWLWYTWRIDNGLCQWTAPEVAAFSISNQFDVTAVNGMVHVVFSHQFRENWEIYHAMKPSRWQGWLLPVNVSRTSGESRWPALSARRNELFAVWQDSTPGYSTVYYAQYTVSSVSAAAGALVMGIEPTPVAEPVDLFSYWSNRPIPSGRGFRPDISTDDWSIFVVFEAGWGISLTGFQETGWQMPVLVSLEGAPNPREPVLIENPDGGVWIFWFQGYEAAEVWQARAWFYDGHLQVTYPGPAPMPSPTPTPTPAPTPSARSYFPLLIQQ